MSSLDNIQTRADTTLVASTDSAYAKRRRQHMSLINQLRSIGAQADLDLPRIAVIGNQSAGKSSLVEAISGISVPRDAGTCTRCPMECRLMSSPEQWSCQVYIRWEFNGNGKRKDKVQELEFGPLIKNKGDVELALRRAQAAVLNPSVDQAKFLTKSARDLRQVTNELKFSRNAVCVQLSGPELTDLAFVDLPGIIQNAEADVVQLVEDLVTSNIKGNCLILVTLPMSDDIENQKAAQLAKVVDPSGLRTIGVMTKPDTLPPGATKSRGLWLDVIEGRRHVTKLGYYCTRQPDDEERGRNITTSQARVAEKEFFSKNAPWATSTSQDRFGTDNLVASLSKLLAKIIDDSLPKLQREVTSQHEFCTRELKGIPAAITSDPASYVLTLVTEFCNDVARHVRGGEAHAAELVQSNRHTYAVFKRDIRGTAPPFMPYSSADGTPSEPVQYVLDGDEDDEDSEGEDAAIEKVGGRRLLYLEDVRKHIQRSLARELPNNVPYSSKISLIESFQASWEMDTRKCFDTIYQTFDTTLTSLVKARFRRYDHLSAHIMQAVREQLKIKQISTWSHVRTILDLEKIPYTQNGHYIQVTKDKHLSLYKAARAEGEPPAKKQKVIMANVVPEPISNPISPKTPAKSPRPGKLRYGRKSPIKAVPSQPVFGVPSAVQQPFTFGAGKGGVGASSLQTQKPITPGDSPASQSSTQATSDTSKASSSPAIPFTFSAPAENRVGPRPSAPSENLEWGTSQKRGLDDEEQQRYENAALSALAMLGYHVTAADLGKLHPPDIYEEELEVMAEVRSYFQVAYKRVIDYVPMMIDRQFLFSFVESVQGFLIEKLGLGTSKATARCQSYLAEDPAIVARRDELSAKRTRLEQVQVELDNFDV